MKTKKIFLVVAVLFMGIVTSAVAAPPVVKVVRIHRVHHHHWFHFPHKKKVVIVK